VCEDKSRPLRIILIIFSPNLNFGGIKYRNTIKVFLPLKFLRKPKEYKRKKNNRKNNQRLILNADARWLLHTEYYPNKNMTECNSFSSDDEDFDGAHYSCGAEEAVVDVLGTALARHQVTTGKE